MFNVDKSLNYGRAHIDFFSKSISTPEIVLDIGAGQGSDLKIVKKNHPTSKLFALENYPEYIKILNENNIETFPGNFETDNLPFNNESVDLIITNQTLEHTKEIFWVLHELSRTLKVGGHLIIGIPNLASFHNRLLLLLGHQPTCINNSSAHIRGFSKNDLIKFLNIFQNGYQLQYYKGSNFYPFSPSIASPLAKAFPGMAWSNFFLFKKTLKYNKEFLEFPKTNQLETNFFLGNP